MIKRIQEIRSVGCFYDTSPSQYQLEPFTIIYGENRHGKSTLCDIFRSLAHDEGSYIKNRKSIPNPDGKNQSVKINFTPVNGKGENIYHFKNGKWDKELPRDYNLLVFDSNFIHRNVFTGLSIERENHENVTEFVFGEESVSIAQNIANEKGNRRSLKKERKQLKENAFAKVTDLEAFIELEVDVDEEKLNKKRAENRAALTKKRDVRENLQEYKSKKEPTYLNVDLDLEQTVQNLNTVLGTSLEEVHQEAEQKVKKHIRSKTKNIESTQGWIKDGLIHLNEEDCPFCGQMLEDDALKLIEAYRDYFDESYEEYEDKIKDKLEEIEKELPNYDLESLEEKVESNKGIISGYIDLDIESESFLKDCKKLKDLGGSVKEALSGWSKVKVDLMAEIKQKIDSKRSTVHNSVKEVKLDNKLNCFEKLIGCIKDYESLLKKIIDDIKAYKDKLSTESIQKDINEIEDKLEKLDTLKRRIDLEEACKNYKKLDHEIKKKEKNIGELEKDLKEHQSKFLNKYFDTINKLYKKLGSDKFKIEKKLSGKGYFPTIKIGATFSGKKITKDKLSYFFSESDRRALALSIFWAKVSLLEEKERKKTIVVLDDPVTSFDEGRIRRSIRIMDPDDYDLRQLIVISHYSEYLKRFFDTNREKDVKLLKITKDQKSSHLSNANSSEFVDTAHQKKLKHILGYIQREHEEDVLKDLRVYLVNELKMRYRKQILESGWDNLNFYELIEELDSNEIISDSVSRKLDKFREELNPSHHVIREGSQEELITLADDVLSFIYHEL